EGRQADSYGAGQSDAPQYEPFGHAEGAGRLDLPMGDGQDPAAENLARIARGIEAESDDAVPEPVPQIRPEEALPYGGRMGEDAAQPVIEQVDLDQQRRAAHQKRVEIARAIHDRIFRYPRQGHTDGQRVADEAREQEDHER